MNRQIEEDRQSGGSWVRRVSHASALGSDPD
jgi:hypothetical protein